MQPIVRAERNALTIRVSRSIHQDAQVPRKGGRPTKMVGPLHGAFNAGDHSTSPIQKSRGRALQPHEGYSCSRRIRRRRVIAAQRTSRSFARTLPLHRRDDSRSRPQPPTRPYHVYVPAFGDWGLSSGPRAALAGAARCRAPSLARSLKNRLLDEESRRACSFFRPTRSARARDRRCRNRSSITSGPDDSRDYLGRERAGMSSRAGSRAEMHAFTILMVAESGGYLSWQKERGTATGQARRRSGAEAVRKLRSRTCAVTREGTTS